MVQFSDTKEIILALKKVWEEKELSIDKTLALVNEKCGEGAVSRSTVQRVFAKDSENNTSGFRYETTLKPLCNALLDIETDEAYDSADTLAYKSILRYKKDIIEDYAAQNKELKDEITTIKDRERAKYAGQLEKETKHFTDSLAFMTRQIQLKDERIDALLAMNTELMQTNNRLLQQLMNCPLKNNEECL